MIEIKEDKFDKMAEYTEKMLKYGGKLMSCLSEVGEEYGISFRGEGSYRGGMNYRDEEEYSRSMMGNRRGYNSRGYNERDDDEWEEGEMSERRGGRRRRDSRGRYM
jgi:hypothetical protein